MSSTFETKSINIKNQEPLSNILEKQTKEFGELVKRMSLDLQTSYKEYTKQQDEIKNHQLPEKNHCHQCQEKDEIINSLKSRIEELETDSDAKSQDIKKLQNDVQALYDTTNKKANDISLIPTKITVTTEIEEEFNNDNSNNYDYYYESTKPVEKEGFLSADNIQYNDNIRDSYSDSAVDLFTDDDDASTVGSVKTDDCDDLDYFNNKYNKYDKPSEWLDISPTLKQRAKIDKKNLDRWNSKMASNGLLPIRLVGKVDAERERKFQTHRKGYSTSAIWLKTYESQQKQNQDDRFKLSSFNFSFNTTKDVKSKSKETSAPISLKSSVSTSVSELTTTSLATTSLATTSLQPYHELLDHKSVPILHSKSQKMLSQYK